MTHHKPCIPTLLAFWEVLYELSIIIRKNIQVWKRRYVALIAEIVVPILVTVIVAKVNATSAIFRTLKLDELEGHRHQSINQSIEQFYVWGTDYTDDIILNYTLCRKEKGLCYIGYVADDATVSQIFENPLFFNTSNFRNPAIWKPGLNVTNATVFIRFPDEASVLTCVAKPEGCSRFKNDRRTIHLFRGAVIFESNLKADKIKYKIRLLEHNYNSLRHVMKTAWLQPTIFDKRDYTKSYLASGFLSLQFHIDRMIITNLDRSSTIESFKDNLALREMPHRHLDQYHYEDEEIQAETAHDDLDFVGKKIKDALREPEVVTITMSCIIVLIMALTFMIPFEERRIVYEKESGLTMILRVTGMSHRMQWIGNLLSVVLLYCFIVTVIVFILTRRFSNKEGAVFELVSPVLLWILLMLYVINLAALCSMFSTFFHQSEIAMTATTAFVLVTFLAPAYHINLLYKELPFWSKILLCVHPCIGLQITFQLLIGYEELALETTFFGVVLDIPTDPMKLIYVILVSICEICFFLTMTMYLDLVLPSKSGAAYPWNYIFKSSYYKNKRRSRVAPAQILALANSRKSHAEPRPWSKASNINSQRDNIPVADLRSKSKSMIIDSAGTKKKKGGAKGAASRKTIKFNNNAVGSAVDPSSTSEQPNIEPCRNDEDPVVETINLTKRYGTNVAVNNINLKLFHGEIVAIIGENSSGKSTLLNMFSGHITPTSGNAKIGGLRLTTQLMQIQSITGMCPQTPVLFEELTTFEHLVIFSRLRGLRGDDVNDQANEFIEKLNLYEMKNTYARNLSKGDARKLSLAIALIGKPEVVVLDEPTGWMDYYSRRVVWDLLLKIRSNHTIIFSTAFMDEAELYGDKIGIMSKGNMELMGSQPFIRRYLGLGYSLKMTIDPKRKPESAEILNIVHKTMPSATLNTFPFSSNADHICNVNLPEDVYSANSMSAMFSDFAQVKEKLGILAFSVSHATMDELFLALMRKVDPDAEEEIQHEDHDDNDEPKLEGCLLSLRQFWDILKNRLQFSIRNKPFTFFHIILPVITTCISIARTCSSVDLSGRLGPPLELTADGYKYHIVPIISSNTFPEDLMKSAFSDAAEIVHTQDVTGTLIQEDYHTLQHYYVIGLSTDSKNPDRLLMHYSPYHFHSSAIAINTYFNILLKKIEQHRSIGATNHPMQHPYFTGPYFDDDSHGINTASALAGLSWALSLVFAAAFPMIDKISHMKHLKLMAGVSSLTYWLACIVADLCMLTISLGVIVVFSHIYPEAAALNKFNEDKLNLIRFAMLPTVAFCGTTMVYFFSHFAYSTSGGFSLFLSMGITFGVILPYFTSSPVRGTNLASTNLLGSKTIDWILIFNPFHSLAAYVRKISTALLKNGKCNHFTKLGAKHYCNVNLTAQEVEDSYEVQCCRNCPLIPGAKDCYDRFEIFGTPWSKRNYSYEQYINGEPSVIHNIRSVGSCSVFYEAISGFILGVLFTFFCVLLDTDVWKYFIACVLGMRGRAFQTDVEDEDVNDEELRVEDMVESGTVSEDMLVTYRLCKTIGTYPVIHNINVGVHPGECFGILGVNGAGKSTLFNLLTGATVETFGNVYSIDSSLIHHRSILMKKMGYLPHIDSTTVHYLTLEEHLQLFSSLRGQTSRESRREIRRLLDTLQLEKYKDKRMKNLSAGIQRTVSIAMALVGKSPIILLDEPTSISDIHARRNFWKLMKDMKKAGQTVIFSSHRIPECEELCDRVAMLIDGKFQCIGSPAHLKNKFGTGFKLLIKLDPDLADNREYVSSLSNVVVDVFSPCFLRDRRRNVIQYVIKDNKISWDYLFQQMEHIKLRYNDLVEDYCFSETKLEEVFLSFVILQYCGRIKQIREGGGCC